MGIKDAITKFALGQDSGRDEDGGGDAKYSQGIGSTVPTLTSNGRGSAREARLNSITFYARLFALFSFFIALCLSIALTTFQNKWVGAPSGLSGFLLFSTSSFLLVLVVITLVPIASARYGGKKIARFERAMSEDRVGFALMGWCLGLGFIISLTQLISALTSKACKDPSADAHATTSTGNDDDFVKALGSFCGTKRATAVFLWMGWLSVVGLSVIFLLNFRHSRKTGPRIPPFTHPSGGSEGAFHAIDDDDHADDPLAYGKAGQDDDEAARYRGYDDQYNYTTAAVTATPAPPGSYWNPLSEVTAKYGMTQPLATSRVSYDPPRPSTGHASNPFAEALANAQPLLSRPPPAPAYEQYQPQQGQEPVNTHDAYDGYAEPQQQQQQAYGDGRGYQEQYPQPSYQTGAYSTADYHAPHHYGPPQSYQHHHQQQ